MKILYFKVNPGGNTTAIVKGEFNKKIKVLITKKIITDDPTVEQVGFWIAAKNPRCVARLDMSGGEFCGNALRAFGPVLLCKKKQSIFLVESSGTKEIIKISATSKIAAITLPLDGMDYKNHICLFSRYL